MTDRSRLDARYGRAPLSRRGRILAWTLPFSGLAALLMVWLLWANPFGFGDAVDAKDLTHSVVDKSTVRVRFQLTAQPGRRAACAIKAMDFQFSIVGWRVVEYPASTEFIRTFSTDVTTVKPAVTGLVASCWLL